MPKFTDDNRIIWDIRTSIVQVGTKPPEASWFAAVDDESDFDYSANAFPLNDEETFGPPASEPRITWPSGGNPIIRGKGNEDDAAATIKLFAAREQSKKARALRVRASTDKGGGAGILILIALGLMILSDGKRGRR